MDHKVIFWPEQSGKDTLGCVFSMKKKVNRLPSYSYTQHVRMNIFAAALVIEQAMLVKVNINLMMDLHK